MKICKYKYFPAYLNKENLKLERRKIQKVGSSTLSVSLPKDWTNRVGVKQGDIVYLDQGEDGTLKILTEDLVEEEQKQNEYYINCELIEAPNLLERLIVGSYLQGVEVTKIFSSTRIDGKQIEAVRNIARRLVGLNIIEESSNEIILQCFINPLKFKIVPLMKRLSVITSTMFNEAMEALLEFKPEIANDVIQREDETNNIYWLLTRLTLSTQRSPTLAKKIDLPFGLTGIRLISKSLEKIADCSESLAKITLDLYKNEDVIDKKELEKLTVLDQLTKEVFQKAVESIFSRDMIVANNALNLREKLVTEVEAQMRTTANPYFRVIAIMFAMIAENSATIAVVTINIEIEKFEFYPHKKIQL